MSSLIIEAQFLSPHPIRDAWVDSVYNRMSEDERVGQLFMVRAFSHDDDAHIVSVKKLIKDYHVGGVCFFQGDPMRQAKLANEYQSMSRIPLFCSIDGEWGLGMRFKDQAFSFPRQLTIGAINDHQLIYKMGREVGNHCLLTGINLNFAPSVDVNNNINNPVINFRSFGEDRYNVATKGAAYMKGMADVGVMSCAKHFPGHGDTDVDSHADLPVLAFTKERLDSVELFPFRSLIQQGVPSIMVAHLSIPSIERRPNRPTTLSKSVITDLLRNEMGFDRLILTDAMEMKGVTKHFASGVADLEAFLAGNDMILLPENIHEGVKQIKAAVKDGRITGQRLAESVKRVLREKYILGLHKHIPTLPPSNLYELINNRSAQVLRAKIFEKALTLVANDQDILPLVDLAGKKYASVSLGATSKTSFQQRLASYVDIEHFQLPKNTSSENYDTKLDVLASKDIVFVSIHDMSWHARHRYGVVDEQISFIRALSKRTKVVLTLFGSPYSIHLFEGVPTILVANEDHVDGQESAAQALMGAKDITGKLPVSVTSRWRSGHGIIVPSIGRLGYSLPEAVGLNSDTLLKIEHLVKEMIEKRATPGCQILVAKDGNIVFQKSFGHHDYTQKRPVKDTDIYDLASITKIIGSTISLMQLQDAGRFKLSDPIKQYIPEEDTTNKAELIYEDVLAHMAGLKPWIPFYAATLDGEKKAKPSLVYYRPSRESGFSNYVAHQLYLRDDYRDTIWRQIFSSSLLSNNDYTYSDLGFYIANKTIKNISGLEVDGYAEINFYRPLGLRRTLFNPLRIFSEQEIVPTEKDGYWRNSEINGTVHDMGAAMLNGVSGHAGLFSNAYEVGVIMQMLLNRGYYGGRQFLRPSTINYYTQRHWRSSRRGIGFDMKELNPKKSMNMSEKASRHTFGHLGFTGTAAFVDPDYDLVFVFLSNRTYPDMDNNILHKENYRPKIQSVIYEAMLP